MHTVPVPGHLRVQPRGAAVGDPAFVERARALHVPDVRIEVVGAGSDATRGRVDLVLYVDDLRLLEPERVVRAHRLLRRDLSTAAVGLSPTGRGEGELELAVSGRLLLVRADALRGVGGWDAAGTGVLDDLDLCARLWLAGHRVRSIGEPGTLLGGEAGEDVQAEAWRRTLATVLDDEDLAAPAWAGALAEGTLGAVRGRRAAAQRSRRRGSGELVPMLHEWARCLAEADPAGVVGRVVLAELGSPHRAGVRRRVLVVTTDILAPAMAGPGIRAAEVAKALSADHEVVLATTAHADLAVPGVEVRAVGEAGLEAAVAWCDVVVFQGWVLAGRPWLRDSPKVVVADLYDPMHLEQLEQGHEALGERGRYDAVRGAAATLNEQMRRADLMLCASAKQRDLWLGALGALGRINTVVYDDDPSLHDLLVVAPFGVPDEGFPDGPHALKGALAGIGPDDKVILWGGGVYNWFDPLTLVRAVDRLRHDVPEVRLVFLGLGHPNPEVPEMRMVGRLRALVAELGLEGTHVFLNHGWVPFTERADHLRDADVGVSTHQDHLETEFSFRTRILDYLWAGLPIVATGGDSFAELIVAAGAGQVVPPDDVEALRAALHDLLTDPEAGAAARAGSLALGRELRWARTLGPLVEFCRAPRRAPDVACPTMLVSPDGAELTRGLLRDLRVAQAYLRAGGPRLLVDRALTRLRRLRSRGD